MAVRETDARAVRASNRGPSRSLLAVGASISKERKVILLRTALAIVLPGIGRRVCGGAFQQWTGKNVGDTPARLFFGLTVCLAALLAGVTWWWCLALIPVTWVGTVTGNFGGIAMGRSGNPYWRDFAGMTLHGALSGVLPAAGAWWLGYGWWAIAIAALTIAPLYSIGWMASGKAGNPKLPLGLRGGSELGELFWGGAMGLGTFLAGIS